MPAVPTTRSGGQTVATIALVTQRIRTVPNMVRLWERVVILPIKRVAHAVAVRLTALQPLHVCGSIQPTVQDAVSVPMADAVVRMLHMLATILIKLVNE